MATQSITVNINGEAKSAEIEDRLLLVHFIRDNHGLINVLALSSAELQPSGHSRKLIFFA